MNKVAISNGYQPGAVGRVAQLHAEYYSRNWGFGLYFEAKVAVDLSDFLLRFDPERDGFWLAMSNDHGIVGSIAIDGIHAADQGAHLRWFITAEVCRGSGAGQRLLAQAIEFCRQRRYDKIYLHTFAGLDAARYLYEKHGFVLVDQHPDDTWGVEVNEQRFELGLV